MSGKDTRSPAQRFEEECARLAEQGYTARDHTVGIVAANVYGILTALPFAAVGILAFVLSPPASRQMLSVSADLFLLAFLAVLSVPLHEALHALAWAAASGGFAGIRLGFTVRALTPWCACARRMRRAQYFSGVVAPFVLLGAGFCVAACCTGYWALCALGVFNVLSAGADLLVAFRLLFARGEYVLDHPRRCGFVSFSR